MNTRKKYKTQKNPNTACAVMLGKFVNEADILLTENWGASLALADSGERDSLPFRQRAPEILPIFSPFFFF